MSSNVIELLRSPRWRVLVAHQSAHVRHALRTLIEDRNITVVEAADGEAALAFSSSHDLTCSCWSSTYRFRTA